MTTTKQTELLPCPFCRQSDFLIEQLDGSSSVVICQAMIDAHSACLARGPVGVQDDDGEDQPGKEAAIREWNTRAYFAPEHLQGEAVKVVGYLSHCTDGYDPDAPPPPPQEPLITVAQHQRILAAATRPADQVADDLTMVKVSRELLGRVVKADASKGANALQLVDGWSAMQELRALLAKP